MKTKIIYVLIAVVLISCGGDKEEPIPQPDPKTGDEIPVWNKNKTATVYMASNFQQKALTESNYDEISSFLKISDFDVAILNRSDVDMATNINGGVLVTEKLKLFSFFNVSGFESKVVKGNTVVLKSPIEKLDTYTKGVSTISNTETKFDGINFPLSVTSLQTDSELSGLNNLLKNVISNNRVLFLETKTDFVPSLKNIVSNYNDTYRVQDYNVENNSSIVTISPKYWLTREVTLAKEYSNQMKVYKIQIEANVFY